MTTENGTISKACAESLVDLAGIVGTMQGMATSGLGDSEIMADITAAARTLIETGVCPISEEDTGHLKSLAERVAALSGREDLEMEEAIAVQEELNAVLSGVLGTP